MQAPSGAMWSSQGSKDEPGRHHSSVYHQLSRSVIEHDHMVEKTRSQANANIPPAIVWQANREFRMSPESGEQRMTSRISRAQTPSGEPRLPKRSACERNAEGMKSILLHPFSTLLVAFPLGIASAVLDWGPMVTFWLNFCALIPLAKILGDATEELDAGLHNEIVSGLLNATFGNAVEMIMTVQTLRAGLTSVVKETLLGSVLSNMLLVLGMSFFFGGIVEMNSPPLPVDVSLREDAAEPLLGGISPAKSIQLVNEKEQVFVANAAMVSVTMLLVSCLSFALPTIFIGQVLTEREEVLQISQISACIVMLSYFAYLWFQLYTHRKMLAASEEEHEDAGGGDDGSEDGEDGDGLTIPFSIGLLAGTTLLVSISSELLVGCIESVVANAHLSEAFIGIILLPIVGNACEHAAAVRFAVKNKPGLSVSIAVGSSVQVALFVVPFSVLIGWYLGVDMTLDFGAMHVTVLIISVLVVLTTVVDGRATWLEGYMLCSAYALIAVMYWHVRSDQATLGSDEL